MLSNRAPVIFTIAFFLLLSACDRLETVERYYVNHESLGKSGEPGNWVPAFIPRSAVEIREKHKTDTGAEVLIFNFREFGDLSLTGFCKKIKAADASLPLSGFLSVTWWPDPLYRDRSVKTELDKYEFYRCERQAFFAIRLIDGRHHAYYWRMSLNE